MKTSRQFSDATLKQRVAATGSVAPRFGSRGLRWRGKITQSSIIETDGSHEAVRSYPVNPGIFRSIYPC